MSTMRACYYTEYGKADKVLKFGELPMPELEGPNDVLIKVHAASINPADFKHCEGELRMVMSRPFPIKPGFDFSRVIVKKGDGVGERLNVGDEVFGMIRGLRTGTTAEFIVVDEHVISKKPANLSHKEAAGVPLAAITAFQCLSKAGLTYPPSADAQSKSVFVTGGPGGVGTFVIQVAKKMFAVGTVVTTAGGAAKAEVCKSLGADEVIDYKSVDFRTALKGRKFDACVDCTGETSKMVGLVKEKGGITTIQTNITTEMLREWLNALGPNPGITPVPIVKSAIFALPQSVINLFTGASFLRHRLPSGAVFHSIITVPSREVLDKIANHLENGEVRVLIDQVFPLDQSRDAYLRSASGKAVGKVIVDVIPS